MSVAQESSVLDEVYNLRNEVAYLKEKNTELFEAVQLRNEAMMALRDRLKVAGMHHAKLGKRIHTQRKKLSYLRQFQPKNPRPDAVVESK